MTKLNFIVRDTLIKKDLLRVQETDKDNYFVGIVNANELEKSVVRETLDIDYVHSKVKSKTALIKFLKTRIPSNHDILHAENNTNKIKTYLKDSKGKMLKDNIELEFMD